ncbi:MAG: four helix bundle protein [Muribaculaceae bacterium]|nr:four helix bundle protein [Muribaculaceae bacterium]
MGRFENNAIAIKSKDFAIRCVNLSKYLKSKKEFTLSDQLLRSGTSIGANVREALRAYSKTDFVYKLNVAQKEAEETGYWLELLHETDYISNSQFNSMNDDCEELLKLLASIIITTRQNGCN